MNRQLLAETIELISVHSKGILAADESTGTIAKRFEKIGILNTEENRRDYRTLLFTTPGLSQYISGAILFEETLKQKSFDGTLLTEILQKNNIVPGIKVDKGLAILPGATEKFTKGIDDLAERLVDYKQYQPRFAKWRAVFDITNHLPSRRAIHSNAELLALYAATCQAHDIVPIVEPEVLMDGNHTIERCYEVTESVLHHVFNALYRHDVALEYIILKPNMVIEGTESAKHCSAHEVAQATLEVLRHNVPAAVPTINFLSGGQSSQRATENLQAMNISSLHRPWHVSYSYGRALQDTCLSAWQGKPENVAAAQAELLKRSKLNSLAVKGEYQTTME